MICECCCLVFLSQILRFFRFVSDCIMNNDVVGLFCATEEVGLGSLIVIFNGVVRDDGS